MSTQNRYNVVPTVTVLAVMKGRLTGAVKGHALLKKKADALTMRFRQVPRGSNRLDVIDDALQAPPLAIQARNQQALLGFAKCIAAAFGLLAGRVVVLCL